MSIADFQLPIANWLFPFSIELTQAAGKISPQAFFQSAIGNRQLAMPKDA
ncbi:MAG: hypothetical protein LC776_05395 [Acidobacteria bacterium]|nr:hypothetical protein [Acidobacteriota bacterium]